MSFFIALVFIMESISKNLLFQVCIVLCYWIYTSWIPLDSLSPFYSNNLFPKGFITCVCFSLSAWAAFSCSFVKASTACANSFSNCNSIWNMNKPTGAIPNLKWQVKHCYHGTLPYSHFVNTATFLLQYSHLIVRKPCWYSHLINTVIQPTC